MTLCKAHPVFIFIIRIKVEGKSELVAAVGVGLKRGFKEKEYVAKILPGKKKNLDTGLGTQSNN